MIAIPLTGEAWLPFTLSDWVDMSTERRYTLPRVGGTYAIKASLKRGSAIRQCWFTTRSVDSVDKIFTSPMNADSVEVLDTLTHDLVCAVDDCKNLHDKGLKAIELSIGLKCNTREVSAGPTLKSRFEPILLLLSSGKPTKQQPND